MKTVVLTFVASIFLIVGCQDSSSVLAPTDENIEASTLNKGRIIIDRRLDGGDDLEFLYDKEEGSYAVISKTFTVNGSVGDNLVIAEKYGGISMAATLTIPAGAFEGELTFDILFDFENFAVELLPSPFTFDKPLLLDLRFTGVDFEVFGTNLLDFDYLDGESEDLVYKHMYVNQLFGTLVIVDAQLSHFSRYGWVRRK